MSIGLSLHIGLNNVDPESYDGWNATLAAAEKDAEDMSAIAKSQGFETTLLKAPVARVSSQSCWARSIQAWP